MTKDKDEKAVIRARMARTGESYAAARAQLSSSADGQAAGGLQGISFTATPAVSVALKSAPDYGGGPWGLILALSAGDGTAAHVLAGLGLEAVTADPSGRSAETDVADQAEAGTVRAVLPAAVGLAQAEQRTVLDTSLLLRGAVSVLADSHVPSRFLLVASSLRAANLAKHCAAAERQHGPEQAPKNVDGSERTGMFERFTDRARQVVVKAQEAARAMEHSHIGTEHLLLGLLGVTNGVAAKALVSLGISPDQTRAEVEELTGRGDEPASGHIPFTPRAKSTLEHSLRSALEMNHNYIGTEHLLLGLLDEPDGVACTVLFQKEGISVESVRTKVIQLLNGTADGPARTGD